MHTKLQKLTELKVGFSLSSRLLQNYSNAFAKVEKNLCTLGAFLSLHHALLVLEKSNKSAILTYLACSFSRCHIYSI